MNGPVDAPAAQQRLVGGVDDGVHRQRGNIALDDLDARIHGALAKSRHISTAGTRTAALTGTHASPHATRRHLVG